MSICVTEFGLESRFATTRDPQRHPVAGGVAGQGWIAAFPVAAAPVPDVLALFPADRPFVDASGLIGSRTDLQCAFGLYGFPSVASGLALVVDDTAPLILANFSGYLTPVCSSKLPAWCLVPVEAR